MDPISAYGVLMLVAGLQIKHMVFDGPAQTRWMLAEKGIYGATGGLVHSGNHLIGSLVVLLVLGFPWLTAMVIAAGDGVIHYHIDFFKEQIVKARKLTPADQGFWWTLAIDQSLHHMTYIAMVAILIAIAA
jgi:hypothetical protein